jgi:hypothetical protein
VRLGIRLKIARNTPKDATARNRIALRNTANASSLEWGVQICANATIAKTNPQRIFVINNKLLFPENNKIKIRSEDLYCTERTQQKRVKL